MEFGRPLISTTTTGLPSANIARASSFCSPTRSRDVASPRWLSAQASRLVAPLPPTASTIASAVLRDLHRLLDARAILRGIREHDFVSVPVAFVRDLHAFGGDDVHAVARAFVRMPSSS